MIFYDVSFHSKFLMKFKDEEKDLNKSRKNV